MNSRDKQREERRKEILLCGLNMIVTRGYESTKIRDIAKELHISTGLFFNYFKSKDSLYEELIRIALQGPESVLHFNAGDADPVMIFEKITEYIINALRDKTYVAKFFILMAQAMRSNTLPANVKQLISGFDPITPLIPAVQKGQKLGRFKQGEPAKLIAMYWLAIQGLAENFSYMDSWPPEVGSWIMDIIRA